jgi:hypothetical protein
MATDFKTSPTEGTVTGLALKEATNKTNYNKQNVSYKMKYNATTKQWEQEQIMTPLVAMTYPGIRTKDGGTKNISGGLKDAPVVKPIDDPFHNTLQNPKLPDTPETPITAPSTGIGGYQQTRQNYQDSQTVQGVQKSAGVSYSPDQMNSVSESRRTRSEMKYSVMPGGYNSRSDAQVLSQSGEAGVLRDLLNPTATKDNSKMISALGGVPVLGSITRLAGFMGPRSEKSQIERLLKSGMINVTGSDGKSLDYDTALKTLTEDDKGRLKILKGEDLINSGYKITQNKTIANEYKNSPAFMNIKEDKANNYVTTSGIQLTTLNPVMGSAGTSLFGILGENKGASQTNGEQVLVIEGSGAYRSDGKFVSMGGEIYSRGTASDAKLSANGGLIPTDVLKRMTNKDGTLKDLYQAGGDFEIDSNMIDSNGKYIGKVVMENRNIVDNNGNVVGNTAPDGSQDKQNHNDNQQKEQDDIRDETDDYFDEIYGSDPEPETRSGGGGTTAPGQSGGYQHGGNDSGSDNSSKDKKIICTEMYRQTQLDDWQRTIKLWYIFQQKHLSETHQKGYHFLFRPYVKGMQKSSILTSIGKHMAQERTKDIKHIMYGTEFSLKGRVYRTILEPICYIIGLFIRG